MLTVLAAISGPVAANHNPVCEVRQGNICVDVDSTCPVDVNHQLCQRVYGAVCDEAPEACDPICETVLSEAPNCVSLFGCNAGGPFIEPSCWFNVCDDSDPAPCCAYIGDDCWKDSGPALEEYVENETGPTIEWIESIDLDVDSDGVPDAAEAALCGREVVREALADNGLGHCNNSVDYVALDPAPIIADANDRVNDTVEFATTTVEETREDVEAEVEYYYGVVLDVYGDAWVLVWDTYADAMFLVGSTVDEAEQTADETVDTVHTTIGDMDQDGVPDDREPLVCSAEDQNLPQDGTCSGDDYTPPV